MMFESICRLSYCWLPKHNKNSIWLFKVIRVIDVLEIIRMTLSGQHNKARQDKWFQGHTKLGGKSTFYSKIFFKTSIHICPFWEVYFSIGWSQLNYEQNLIFCCVDQWVEPLAGSNLVQPGDPIEPVQLDLAN